MDNIDKNQRKTEVALRRSKFEKEKQMKYNTFLQENESREQRASKKREEGIRKAKEKAEAKNQRVQAASERIKSQQNGFEECKCGSFRASRRSSTFQQKNHISPPSRLYSMDTLSVASTLQSPPSPQTLATSSHSSLKSKSVANLKVVFEPSAKAGHHNNIKKLAKSIRNAAIHTKVFVFSSSPSQPQPTVHQTSEEILDEMDRLKMDIGEKDGIINQLEEYIDNLLCEIIENCPHLLEL